MSSLKMLNSLSQSCAGLHELRDLLMNYTERGISNKNALYIVNTADLKCRNSKNGNQF